MGVPFFSKNALIRPYSLVHPESNASTGKVRKNLSSIRWFFSGAELLSAPNRNSHSVIAEMPISPPDAPDVLVDSHPFVADEENADIRVEKELQMARLRF